ncbi:putative MarR family transcriptional regulator [Kineosphaera limosa NBRC 100340]|uniref:Putative MarR family transcriptional regulator n=1 Tax=Kineosphaera limosa NBRC 100340 TaxID=1184609 RepID=K6VEW7_9MICO|nr:MarR family transcriptional regulator [Kineosphaera limosa]GAB94733.1 putative MarR family transcriptional regulator [Kineosphaera limosa NBRC 100340]
MGIRDDAPALRTTGWHRLAALHHLIESELETDLQRDCGLSVVEFTVMDALSRQDGWHMRMSQLARVASLSPSASTRLVTRLEKRGLLTRILCADDRRGIYTELTASGREALGAAQPVHDAALHRALDAACELPELADLVELVPDLRPQGPGVRHLAAG